MGAIIPHAGIIFSEHHAIHSFEIISISPQNFDTIIIINPNHTGKGIGIANTSLYEYWETPLGKIKPI